ncbi:lasso RiPP family leader peptide-containing protein [Litorilinea aerophila]|uniref:Lasso RiPP family leader peptide-containing protein n=1 Tax=Litorilinea aerophila TaxID=1204385 RepID=A0A540VBU7_9CHLR|nr:lasso RiPP family leader peptide-containing protein [Litorilinea aerophila]MCC9077933.1 lasso RiPP family leader peptide-containing protein [Litorilinea aerophila]GIV76710.1 MAG: hypothetical protein KatS3mg050_1104 [Litorilinea sp.]
MEPSKKPYAAPLLKEYGAVREVTQASTARGRKKKKK